MPRENRREFLIQTTAGLAGVAMLNPGPAPAPGGVATPAELAPDEVIPPHRPMPLPGIHAYAERSVAAGGTVHFRVSSTLPYELAICRLGPRVDDPSSDEELHRFGPSAPKPSPIHPGSYVHIEASLPAETSYPSLTVQCWVRPWRIDREQGLVTQFDHDGRCGLALLVSPQGQVQFYLGDGGPSRQEWLIAGPKLQARRWHHVVGVWDGRTQALWLDGEPVAVATREGPARPGGAPLRLGALGRGGQADGFLDGDLAMPSIHGRALVAAEVLRLYKGRGLDRPGTEGLLAFWPLDEEVGARVADRSGGDRHGRIINRGTWMIGGPSFDATAVPRFGDYDPAEDDRRGHALRLAADDLYDCRWAVAHEFTVPPTARSGLYVGRFRHEVDGRPRHYDVTFIVRKAADRPPAPILVLCSTSTWQAYGGTPFAKNVSGPANWGTGGLDNSVPEAPAYCCYRDHHAGQPTYQLGTRVPWPVAGPEVLYSPPGVGYSHLTRGERFTHLWLDEQGYEYDVISDHDLHRDPGQLDGYRILLINGHSEYWSIPAYEGVDRFLRGGGRAVVLSGNTMFWRVSFDDDGSVMECRKFDPSIGGGQATTIGELWHSHDRIRGSLMRECGYPAWEVLGLECIGWWGTGRGSFGDYTTEAPDHTLFRGPERVDLSRGETFGHAPGGVEPRAVGHEADVRLSTLRAVTRPPFPPGARLPEEPAGIVTLARSIRRPTTGTILDYFARPTRSLDGTCAELIYWKRPQGGEVFHGGAIAGGWALSADLRWQSLLRNVLHHFGARPGGP